MNLFRFSFRGLITKILAMICFSLWTSQIMATEKYALLVGVSHYPNLEERFQLKGPANDVALIQQVLLEKGFAENHIQILADGLTSKMPTRKNILTALDHLTQQVNADDFVLLHFSGHGSQQPVSATNQTHNEPDGLDEIFLPRDIGNWQDDIGMVKNAIVDDEFKKYLTILRNKGVSSWLIFDSCHSGTMTRGISKTAIRERRVSPHALGVPTQALESVRQAQKSRGSLSRGVRGLNSPIETPLMETELPKSRGSLSRGLRGLNETMVDKQGSYVAFYAAQTTETTPEMPLPVGYPDKRSYGLFTYTLAEVLTQYDNITYRQAGQLVLQRYAAQNHFSPTPSYEGTLMDAPIFGTQNTQRIPQWQIQTKLRQLQIATGQLHGLAKGSILAIVPDSAASKEAILGYVQITRVGISESIIKSIAYNKKPVLPIQNIPKNAYARLVESKISLTLRIALPPEPLARTKLSTPEIQARRVLAKMIQSQQDFGVNLIWVPADEDADLYLLLKADQLWLLPPTGELVEKGPHKNHSIRLNTTEQDLHDKLVSSFQAIAKVISLLRMSQQMPRGLFANQILINVNVERAGQSINFTADKILTLSGGDIMTLSVENKSHSAVDVTILFIDSEYGITSMYPAEYGEINRIEAGGNDWLELELYADTIGIERLVIIATEAKSNAMMKDFSFLAQPRLPRTRGSKRNLYDLFLEAGFGVQKPGTRGAKIRKGLNQTVIKVFSWKIAPKNVSTSRGIRG